jgi:hypothetical protein
MKSPFKFLDSYTKDDREIFFGREREIEELYHRVFESKIMLVYGVSGTGKSSLIHCGLANKFQDTDWLPLVIRRGGNIIDSMAAAIKGASITEQHTKLVSPGDFKKGVRSLYLDHYKPVFFIFDQFEELFIFGDKEERKAFILTVKSLIESELQCHLIFVMREEYMAGVTEFEKVIPTFFSNRVRIEKMSHLNALEAIKGPCNIFNITLEDGFAETLLGKLSPDENEIELTYLQVFLDRIFKLAVNEVKGEEVNITFKLEMLEKTGKVSDLLGRFLEEQIVHMDDPDNALAVLKSFVSVKGTKKQMSPEEVLEYTRTFGKVLKESDLQEMLHKFVNLRILRDKDESGRYELRHDALATKIYEKITLVEKEILEIRQFVENAYANYEKRQIFLETADLNYIAPYIDKLFVNKKLSDFIENSRKNITAKKRAFNRTLRYSFIGFFVIIIAVIVYYFRSSISAKAEELTFESFLQRDFSPALSFNTAMSAYSKDSTSTAAKKALFDAFYALLEDGPYSDTLGNELNPQKAIFDFTPCNSKIIYARFSKDGKYIYGYQEDNTVNIWDLSGKTILSLKEKSSSQIISLKFAPDNNYISAVYLDSTAYIWNDKGKLILKSNVVFDPLNPLDVISFAPDKKIVSMLRGNKRITIFNLEDTSHYELEGHSGDINGAVFSPDGKFLASASKDSTFIIWQLNDSSGYFEKVYSKYYKSRVWSVDFAMNSKYLLCVSDSIDYPVTICSLNGKRVFRRIFYNDTIEARFLARYPKYYHGRYFSACFIANDAAIRISTFSDKLYLSDRLDFQPGKRYEGYNYCRIIYSDDSYGLVAQNKYLKDYGVDRKNIVLDPAKSFNYSYSFADISSDYYSVNLSGTTNSELFQTDRLQIRKFKGTQPCFAPDGNYMLCLDGNKLRLYPAHEKELIRLTINKSIFGKLDPDLTGWRHFTKDW